MSEENKTVRPGGMHGGGPGGALGMPVQKAKDFKGTLKRLLGYLKPFKANLIIVIVFAIISTAFSVYAPQITKSAMNSLQDGFMAKTIMQSVSEIQQGKSGGTSINSLTKEQKAKIAVVMKDAGVMQALIQLSQMEPCN